uniref:EF-hand domain-containing protein n=1 Tax=Heterosigma akashiwo TaxID=2829 RepID=A0A6S9FI83_HETAK|mmetsp:Transcript_55101/g.80430  ORF Transcript_55101/g.80430 Transcript_55101/m.80430 type:complete len:175 (-) Transcript_55101:196-720(-)
MLKRAEQDRGSSMIGGRIVKRKQRIDLTEDEKIELKEAFTLFDANKTGSIDLHELKVLIRALGFPVKKQEVLKMVHDVDPHNDGFVDMDTYMEIMQDKYALRDPDEEILKAFALFDDDSSGFISAKNMRRVARELGENLGDEEIQAMIDEFDRDQDGEISRDEFKSIMKQSSMY